MQTVSETFADTITVNRQMRLALPRMAMSLLIMSYLVADGVLISRFVGTTALSALSMSYPLTALLIAAGFMIAAGGGAVAARALGAQKHEEALRAFSTALTTNIMLGLTLGLLAWFGLDWVFELLGISPEQTEFARDYQRVLLPATPLFLAAATFEVFYTTSGRPKAGLAASAASGITNVVFDILFMGPLDMGMTGAAWATALSWLIGAACGLWYFMREKSPLKLELHLLALQPCFHQSFGYGWRSSTHNVQLYRLYLQLCFPRLLCSLVPHSRLQSRCERAASSSPCLSSKLCACGPSFSGVLSAHASLCPQRAGILFQ